MIPPDSDVEGILGYDPEDTRFHYADQDTANAIRDFWVKNSSEATGNLENDRSLDGLWRARCGAFREEGRLLLFPALEKTYAKVCSVCLATGAVGEDS